MDPETAALIVEKLVQRLFRLGLLDADDLHSMARELTHDGSTEAADALKALWVMAGVDEAEGKRGMFRIVPTMRATDGGNDTN